MLRSFYLPLSINGYVLTKKGCDLTGDRTRDLAHRRPRTNQLEIQVCINENKCRELDTNQISKPPSVEKE